MRKNGVILLIFAVLMATAAGMPKAVHSMEAGEIYKNGVRLIKPETVSVEGKVRLKGSASASKLELLVTHAGSQYWYDIELNGGSFDQDLWLIWGEGRYTIDVMVQESGNTYRFGPEITVDNTIEVNRFLVPTKHVESDREEIVKKAAEITAGADGDLEKARRIYDWVHKNIDYDEAKHIRQKSGDYSNSYGALNTLKERKGVCYDYAALAAALGRAAGLQVKMVKGYAVRQGTESLHAWNEVYISEEDRWLKFDSTVGAFEEKQFDNSDFDEKHVKTEEY